VHDRECKKFISFQLSIQSGPKLISSLLIGVQNAFTGTVSSTFERRWRLKIYHTSSTKSSLQYFLKYQCQFLNILLLVWCISYRSLFSIYSPSVQTNIRNKCGIIRRKKQQQFTSTVNDSILYITNGNNKEKMFAGWWSRDVVLSLIKFSINVTDIYTYNSRALDTAHYLRRWQALMRRAVALGGHTHTHCVTPSNTIPCPLAMRRRR